MAHINSVTTKAYHPMLIPKHFIKPYVNGIKMTSCLAKVMTKEVFALFKAWKAAHRQTQS